jgi:hypothetical protein
MLRRRPGSRDFPHMIRRMLRGEYNNPIRIVVFNTAEGLS